MFGSTYARQWVMLHCVRMFFAFPTSRFDWWLGVLMDRAVLYERQLIQFDRLSSRSIWLRYAIYSFRTRTFMSKNNIPPGGAWMTLRDVLSSAYLAVYMHYALFNCDLSLYHCWIAVMWARLNCWSTKSIINRFMCFTFSPRYRAKTAWEKFVRGRTGGSAAHIYIYIYI